MARPLVPEAPPAGARYVRRVVPLHFPESMPVPESRLHMDLRVLLYQLLRDHVGAEGACFGSDQFVYWDAADPRKSLAPDGLVKLGVRDAPFGSWKTWERGAPDVAIEITSESDASEASLEEKLRRYRAVGVRELVRFDASAAPGARLRLWERVEHDLVERVVEADRAASGVLELAWVAAPAEGYEAALRITRGRAEEALVPTREEARRAEQEARRVEQEARRVAEAEVARLRAELERVRGEVERGRG